MAPAVRIVLKEGLTEWNTGNLWMHLTKYAELKDKYMKKNAALSELQAAKDTQIVTQSARHLQLEPSELSILVARP